MRKGQPGASVRRTAAASTALSVAVGCSAAATLHALGHAFAPWEPLVAGSSGALACASCLSPHWPGVRRRLPSGNGVALTFDDGPSPEATPRILDALGAAGAKAAFFVLGEEVARFPHIARRIASEGHVIGVHGWDHRPMTWVSQRDALALLKRARDAVYDATGRNVICYRAPWGHRGPGLAPALRRLGWRNIGWRVAARDWRAATPDAVTRRVQSAARPRDIILLHDGGPGAIVTASALPDLLAALERRGLGCDLLP